MTRLVRYEAARSALVEARTLADVKDIRDKAEAMRAYARMANDKQLEMDASDIRTRAEHKLGVMLRATERAKPTGSNQHEDRSRDDTDPPTLNELGITKNQSAKAQRLALMPEDKLEEALARARERYEAGAKHFSFDPSPINGARSIMGSRQEPDDSLDYFPTPPWATRALIECVLCGHWNIPAEKLVSAWEPACGEGHMADVLAEYFRRVIATDIHPYGYGSQADFLSDLFAPNEYDWIITNPPFGDKTEQFVLRALARAGIGVAMFVRLQWLETVGRYERIFKPHPPALIAQFSERVPLCKGRWNPDGDTATAYAWLLWMTVERAGRTEFMWIPPGQREGLTYPDDAERFTTQPVKRRLPPTTPSQAKSYPTNQIHQLKRRLNNDEPQGFPPHVADGSNCRAVRN